MTKTGRVAKLNKLDSGPFVELHPADAHAMGIAEGQPVELTSRRGRAVLPAVLTDRVRPGNCFAPFHWNDEHGEYLTVNAVTNDAVDADSLQPEFKVCAVRARPVGPAPTPVARTAVVGGGHGPLVLWASQTGNAEDFAARLARRLGDSQLVNMDDVPLSRLAAARDVVDRHQHIRRRRAAGQRRGLLASPRMRTTHPRSTVCAMPCSASATVPMPTSAAMRSRSTAGSPPSARPGCWTARNVRPMTTGRCRSGPTTSPPSLGVPSSRTTAVDEPFTRADPAHAKLCRNTVLTAPLSLKRGAAVRFRHLRIRRRLRGRRFARGVRRQQSRRRRRLAGRHRPGRRGDRRGRRRPHAAARRADPRPTTSAGSPPTCSGSSPRTAPAVRPRRCCVRRRTG